MRVPDRYFIKNTLLSSPSLICVGWNGLCVGSARKERKKERKTPFLLSSINRSAILKESKTNSLNYYHLNFSSNFFLKMTSTTEDLVDLNGLEDDSVSNSVSSPSPTPNQNKNGHVSSSSSSSDEEEDQEQKSSSSSGSSGDSSSGTTSGSSTGSKEEKEENNKAKSGFTRDGEPDYKPRKVRKKIDLRK